MSKELLKRFAKAATTSVRLSGSAGISSLSISGKFSTVSGDAILGEVAGKIIRENSKKNKEPSAKGISPASTPAVATPKKEEERLR